MSARVALGRIVGVFGVLGWVKVYSYTRPIDGIFRYRRWWLSTPPREVAVQVLESRTQGRGLVARLAEVDGAPIETRERAAAIVGAQIEVAREALPPLPRGQYYWCDLIGLAVQSQRGEPLGTVTAVTDNGAQDVLVIADGARERLIPFVRGPIVKAVELKRRRIVVDWSADY